MARLSFRAVALLLIGLLLTSAAAAQSLPPPFDDGFAINSLEPAYAGDRFFTVGDATVPQAADPFRAMLFSSFANQPVLSRTDPVSGATSEVVSQQLYLHANLQYGFLQRFSANLDLPLAAYQKGDEHLAEAPGTALGDVRVGVRVAVLGDARAALALAPEINLWLPTGSQDDLSGDGALRVEPALRVSGRVGPLVYAAKVGALIRRKEDFGSTQIGPSLSFGAGAGVLLLGDMLQLGAEVGGHSLMVSDSDTAFSSTTSPASSTFGAKLRLGAFVIGGGAGPGLSEAPGVAPRAVFSLAYTPVSDDDSLLEEPVQSDRDGDGVVDGEDACPDERGLARLEPETNGCPDAPGVQLSPPADRDADGVPDAADRCPDQAALSSTGDGCPPISDIDQDGILDHEDACPEQAGPAAASAERHGCPAVKEETLGAPSQATGPALVTMSGFQSLKGGRSLIYVDLTAPVVVEARVTGRSLEYVLRGARVPLRNNRNPLLASHFNATVTSARLAQVGTDVKLSIELRADVNPHHELAHHDDGTATLTIELPVAAKAESK